jgi:DNA-binding response OmpR family regulator
MATGKDTPLSVAVVDDDAAFATTLVGWIKEAYPIARVDRFTTRREAVAAVQTQRYDVVTIDLVLENQNDSDGLAVIHACQRRGGSGVSTALFIVSGSPDPQRWRSYAKALDVVDYFEKDPDLRHLRSLFIESFKELVISLMSHRSNLTMPSSLLEAAQWKGRKLNLCESERRLLMALLAKKDDPDPTLTWDDAYKAVKTGTSKGNVRKIASELRKAFLEVDPELIRFPNYPIVNQYGQGYAWKEPPTGDGK